LADHASLSPSGSDRWMTCPGSVNAERGLPDVESSYAKEGTRAHGILEMALRLGLEPAALSEPDMPEDMVEAVGHAVDFIRTQTAIAELLGQTIEVHPEEKLDILNPQHDVWGTSDLVLVKSDEMDVADYKHGQGIVVEPDNNTQLMLYAIGARRRHGPRPRYRLVVIQPRARHIGGPVREWKLTDAQLMAFKAEAEAAAYATLDPFAPRVAGAHCRFCRAASRCDTLRELALKNAVVDFSEDMNVQTAKPMPPSLDPDKLSHALKLLPIVELWINAVWETARVRLTAGEPVPGFKLVAGKAQRKWGPNDDDMQKALLALGLPLELAAPRKLVSPAGAEDVIKTLKKIGTVIDPAALKEHVVKTNSAPTIAPETDPRPAIQVGSEFANVNNDKGV